MKNLLLIVSMAILTSMGGNVLGQTVTGKVTDSSDGMPLPGVSILIKGTSTGTATDVDGNYQLNVSGPQTVLVYSFLGFEAVEETVGNRSTIDVSLSEDASELNEVVVTALGIERNVKALQYSLTQVGGKNSPKLGKITLPISWPVG